MTCGQNTNATPPSPAIAPGVEAIDPWAVARAHRMDPRVLAVCPSFDAPFFQAGLAGYSDAAMRLVARRHGCPYCVTEALLDRTVLGGGKGFAKADLGDLADNVPGGAEDHPLAGQIMGSDPDEMAAAAVKMVEQGRRSASIYRRLAAGEQPGPGERVTASERTFAAIDVNLACPVKKIKSKSRGGHWLRDPGGAIEILRAVRDATPAEVPCTLKIRRGSDDTPEAERNFYRIFDAAYELGYAWATVHGRTVEQKYVGPSRWTFLRDLVGARPDRPIFGSGDVWEAEDIFRMIAYTGVSAVSVARGCIGNPWIFRRARQLMAGAPPTMPTLGEQREALWSHYELSVAINGEERAGLMMRKFGIRFSALHPDPAAVKRAFIAAKSTADWRGVIEAHYPAGSASEPAAEAAGASGAV